MSPLLKTQFQIQPDALEIYRPDGSPFIDLVAAQQRFEASEAKLEASEVKNERLAAKLKELGIDPSDL